MMDNTKIKCFGDKMIKDEELEKCTIYVNVTHADKKERNSILLDFVASYFSQSLESVLHRRRNCSTIWGYIVCIYREVREILKKSNIKLTKENLLNFLNGKLKLEGCNQPKIIEINEKIKRLIASKNTTTYNKEIEHELYWLLFMNKNAEIKNIKSKLAKAEEAKHKEANMFKEDVLKLYNIKKRQNPKLTYEDFFEANKKHLVQCCEEKYPKLAKELNEKGGGLEESVKFSTRIYNILARKSK